MSAWNKRGKIQPVYGKPGPEPIESSYAYSATVAARNTEAHLRWLGAALGVVLNLPGLVGAALKLADEKTNPRELAVITIGAAIFAIGNLFLFHIIRRDGNYLNFWNDKLAELERVNKIAGGIKIFSSHRFMRLRASRSRLQIRLEWAMITCILIWVIFNIMSSLMLAGKGGWL